MKTEDKIKVIDKKIVKASIINAPGTMMFGLGLFAKFTEDATEFYPFLANPSLVNSLILFGIIIMLWGGYQVFSLSKQKSQLKNLDNR